MRWRDNNARTIQLLVFLMQFYKNKIFEIFWYKGPPYYEILKKKIKLKMVDCQYDNGLFLEILSRMHTLTFIFDKSCEFV